MTGAPAAAAAPDRASLAGVPDVVVVLGIYLLSRLLLLTSLAAFDQFVALEGGDGGILTFLTAWDGEFYLRIADGGYPDHVPEGPDGVATKSELAFFWGLPALIRALHALTPLDLRTAAAVVVHLTGAAATVGVWALARIHLDRAEARRAAALFAFAPGAFILSFVYTEGLMIAGAATAFVLARQQRWLLAGLAGAVASSARPTGLVVVVALAILAAQARGRGWRPWVAPAVATVGALAFFLTIGTRVGELGFWFRVEREAWGESFDFGLHAARQLVGLVPPDRGGVAFLVVLFTTALTVGLLLLAARHPLPVPELAYSALVIFSSFGASAVGLRPRLLLLAFPLVVPLARWVGKAAYPYVLVASATAMVLIGGLSGVTGYLLVP